MVNKYKQICRVQDVLTKWVADIAPICATEDVVYECMALRGYTSEEMFNHLLSVGLFKFDSLSNLSIISTMSKEDYELCGLTMKGVSLLDGRYCLPIRTVDGKVSAIVGYFPGDRKYVTTPTFGFSKATSFFGVEHLEYFETPYVCLCEGIFDTLSLQAYGFPAIGNQGLELSGYKVEMLKRYRRIVAFPDSDAAGKSVNPYFVHTVNRNRCWRIPIDHVFATLNIRGIKDVDDYLNKTDVNLKDLHSKFEKSKYLLTLSN